MITKFKRVILFSLLGLSYGLFSYYYFGGWWNSSVGTLLILCFSYLIWGKDFLKITGLSLNLKTAVKSFILAIIITVCAFFLMKYIAAKHGAVIKFTNWRNYYHDVFYILNEEIMIGALALSWMVNKVKFKPIAASVCLAVIFALIHFVFYKWIFNDRGVIGISTLTTLFLVGFVRNNLILQTGHIGYSWALHFGWMVIMFGCIHINVSTNIGLPEPLRFNTYLGSSEMLIISIILATGSLLYWIKMYKINFTHRS